MIFSYRAGVHKRVKKMNLETTYLGLTLKNPVVAAASPLSRNLDTVKRLEDAGTGAIVMYSLFEEQILHEQHEVDHFLTLNSDACADALTYFPEPEKFNNIDAESYLEHVGKLKRSVSIPVIASLNGVSKGGWMKYAKSLQEAGADAIELNIYYVPTDPTLTGEKIEQMYVEDLKAVKDIVTIPVALKIGPYFTSLCHLAQKLESAGADGLVLFNRFFGSDIDLDKLEVTPELVLSTPVENRVPLRWIAILRDQVKMSLVASSGIHSGADAAKMLLAGANAVQLATILIQKGPGNVSNILSDLEGWMKEKDYESVRQMQGSMSYASVAEPSAYERANYMKMLQSL